MVTVLVIFSLISSSRGHNLALKLVGDEKKPNRHLFDTKISPCCTKSLNKIGVGSFNMKDGMKFACCLFAYLKHGPRILMRNTYMILFATILKCSAKREKIETKNRSSLYLLDYKFDIYILSDWGNISQFTNFQKYKTNCLNGENGCIYCLQ